MVTMAVEKDALGKISASVMEALLKSHPKVFLRIGDLVDSRVLAKRGPNVYFDLDGYGTGIVYGKEYSNAKEMLKKLNIGDKMAAKIVEIENEDGFVELSLKEAGSEIIWKEAVALKESRDPVSLKVLEANKGGLVLEWEGIKGFLPASQLKATHYPRVEGGDKEKILEELKNLVGQDLNVTILDFEPKENKLIFSEKGAESEDLKKIVEKYKIGNIVEGEITGVVEFGIFIKIEEGLEGLAHISELDWGLVESPSELFKVGGTAKAKIIAIDGDKISLSVKTLKPDPWEANKDQYKKGDIIEGRVARLNKYGVLVILDSGIYGLVHISEFGSEKKMKETVEPGKTYVFQIVNYRPENKKLSFAFLGKPGEPISTKDLSEPKSEPKSESKLEPKPAETKTDSETEEK